MICLTCVNEDKLQKLITLELLKNHLDMYLHLLDPDCGLSVAQTFSYKNIENHQLSSMNT